jgi:hypothetical protein
MSRARVFADQDSQTSPARARLFQALDFLHAHVYGELAAFGDGAFGIGGSSFERHFHGRSGEF